MLKMHVHHVKRTAVLSLELRNLEETVGATRKRVFILFMVALIVPTSATKAHQQEGTGVGMHHPPDIRISRLGRSKKEKPKSRDLFQCDTPPFHCKFWSTPRATSSLGRTGRSAFTKEHSKNRATRNNQCFTKDLTPQNQVNPFFNGL